MKRLRAAKLARVVASLDGSSGVAGALSGWGASRPVSGLAAQPSVAGSATSAMTAPAGASR